MNFLAHLALAGPSDASLVGNLMADFAKGTRQHLLSEFPLPVVEAMFMHRRIDRFTDSHPCFKEARGLMHSDRRRFAGVVVDIFFDHFLSRHWKRYFTVPRSRFIKHCYQTLERRQEWHSAQFAAIFPYMQTENWLARYDSKAGIQLTLEKVSMRGRHTGKIAECYADFEENYHALEEIFLRLFPDLQQFAALQSASD